MASSAIGGAIFYLSHALPGPYNVEISRGAKVIYNSNGEIFVKGDAENILTYLVAEDRDKVNEAITNIEKRLENEK